MRKALKLLDDLLSNILACFLAFMGIFIFSNVILRYFFNSGLTWAEELSRFLFVWITFIGAILALKDNNHLGFTSLIQKMPPIIKKLFYLISNSIVFYVLWLLLDGSWKMTKMGMTDKAPSTGLTLAFMFGVGILMSISMAIIVLYNIYQAIFVEGAIERLVALKESEDEVSYKVQNGNI